MSNKTKLLTLIFAIITTASAQSPSPLPPAPVAKQDRVRLWLNIAQGAAELGDGITTRKMVTTGGYEADPLARTLLGSHPGWSRMAPIGTAEWALTALVSARLKRSPRFHRVWWVPQAAVIAGHAFGMTNNIRLLRGR
jgi:hypothetical protein